MSETTNIWVRTSVLEKAITGKTTKEARRGLPSDDEDEFIDWGWAYATLRTMDDQFIEISVNDENSPHHGETTRLPPDTLQTGDILMGNKYKDEEDMDEHEHDEGTFPDDLITLTHLHEPEVVHCLRQRYLYDKIYTSTGPILLALNPFKNCKKLYSKKVMEEYWARGELFMKGIIDEDNPLPPHVYSIADHSFRIMMQTFEENKTAPMKRGSIKGANVKLSDQSILVSGESGAGKTVTTKFIMQYLATLSERTSHGVDSAEGTASAGGQTIEQQVLQSNPILESFGNARTIRNDNSSRFGKFIEIKFNNHGTLVGASIETYLLEKVRLISQAEGERNYHIFYELFCMDDSELKKYHLEIYNPEDFNMTNQSGTYDRRDGVEDFETYDDLKKAMRILGMSEEEQETAFTIPAAALHASNVTFVATSNDESELDYDNAHLDPFVNLMGLTKDALEKALCYLKIKAGKEHHIRTLPKAKAEKGMEALVKAFYGALFAFLVRRINSSITVKDSTGDRRSRGSSSLDQATIGVLDIFGFESFKHNSFEQLCINYCNEALQQQFNLFVLKNEQAEYNREGIEWSFISFPDNQDVLDLIDKKGSGILNILDDQCRAPGTTDKTFCIDLYKKCTGHPRFEADFRQVGAELFGVKHYAGPVEYCTVGFVEKNRDELPKEATDLLLGSTSEMVQELAAILSDTSETSGARSRSKSPSRHGTSSVKVTVGGQFSRQLHDLRDKIDLTSPHYVRCLKPNDLLLPDHFNPLIISDQLRYAGVIEAVRVSRIGYPHRYTHSSFVARYRILTIAEIKKAQRATKKIKPVDVVVRGVAAKVWKVQCARQLAQGGYQEEEKKDEEPPSLMSVGIQVGKTKVFLRREAYEILEHLRSGKNAEAAILIQKTGRRYIDRHFYTAFRHDVIVIQCCARIKKAKEIVNERRIHYRATRIQTMWRRGIAQRHFFVTLAVAKWIQRVQRGRSGRRRYETLNRTRKAIVLQKSWRGQVDRKKYESVLAAILTLQCAFRSCHARHTLKNLRVQARDLGSAVAERDALRLDVQNLRHQLNEAKVALDNALVNVSSSTSQEELEAAHARIGHLLEEARESRVEMDIIKAAKDVAQQRALEAESAAAKFDAKGREQHARAEKYKKLFTEEREKLKELNEDLLARKEQVHALQEKLLAAEAIVDEVKETGRATIELLEQELAVSKAETAREKDRVSVLTDELSQVMSERDDLISRLQSTSSSERTINESTLAELEKARMRIEELKSQVKKIEKGSPPSQELEAMERELEETQEQAAADLQRKDKEIAQLKKELEAAEQNVDSPTISEERIASLQEQVTVLKQKLRESELTQSAGELDRTSPAALAQRYEELRRLAEAGLEKDREIEKLKAKIEDLEADEPPTELNNTDEVKHLRLYIHELQIEISKLREQTETHSRGSTERSSTEKNSSKRSGLLSILLPGGSDHGLKSHPQDAATSDETDDRVGELEDEIEALKEVNTMLRADVEKSRKKIRDLEKDLQDERETSKRELESFARTLRGVDELRAAAEGMSRQVKQFKVGPPRSRSAGRGFNDEVVEDFDTQYSDSLKMIDSARANFEHDAAERSKSHKKPHGFWGMDLMSGKGGKRGEPEKSDQVERDPDTFDDDVQKLMDAKKQKRKKKKKRRGSGNSIVSSFF
jgi:myosin-5